LPFWVTVLGRIWRTVTGNVVLGKAGSEAVAVWPVWTWEMAVSGTSITILLCSEFSSTRGAVVGGVAVCWSGLCGKSWIPVELWEDTGAGAVGWRTPSLVAMSPGAPFTAATNPANGALSWVWAMAFWSATMADWSCWMRACAALS